MSKKPSINIQGEITFSRKSRMDLFLKLCENSEIPFKFDESKINKSKRQVYFYHYIGDNKKIIYTIHFLYVIDCFADANIILTKEKIKIRLNRGVIFIYNLIEIPKLNNKYKIPKSEEYFFKKKIYEFTGNKKLGRKLLGMKLKGQEKF